jgi:hypothetical protein
VRRTLRILRVILTVLSLLLCIAAVVFWLRSRHSTDTLILSPFPTQWSLSTKSGTLYLTRDQPWLEPEDLRSGIRLAAYDRSWLGFGRKQSQEPRTWQSKSLRTIPYTTILRVYFIPLWFCTAFFSILPLIAFRRHATLFHRRKRGLCARCGYDLRASPTKCPECGAAVQNDNAKAPLAAPR